MRVVQIVVHSDSTRVVVIQERFRRDLKLVRVALAKSILPVSKFQILVLIRKYF